MSENVKIGLVLGAALLLGGLVTGLVMLAAPERDAERAMPPQTSMTPAVPPPAQRDPAVLAERPASDRPRTSSPAKPRDPALVQARPADVPTVDFFGDPLDDFAREVIERVGIAGEVVMAGKPVPGAQVELRRVSRKIVERAKDFRAIEAEPLGGQTWTACTDEQGKFAFYGLDEGHYGLIAYTDAACGVDDMTVRGGSIPGRYPGKTAYFAGRSRMSIELWPSSALTGRVLMPNGQPIADADVYPYQIQYPTGLVNVEAIPQVFLRVKTDANGCFQFPRLPAGRWQLAIRATGYGEQLSDWLPGGDPPAEIRLKTQENLPPAVAPKSEDASFTLADYRGKYVLLDFWATWCKPCHGEIPYIKSVFEEFKNDPRFVVIGMNLDIDTPRARGYISENGLGWSQVFLGDWNQSKVAKQFGVESIPYLILLDPEGHALAKDLRGPAIREAVRKALGAAEQPRAEASPLPAEAAPAPAAHTPTPEADLSHSGNDDSLSSVLHVDLDVDLDYRAEGFPMGLSAGQTDALPLTERPCKTLTAEPAYHSAHVRYGYLRLGNAEDNRFTFVIDDLEQKTWIGYFDRNNNADLTDDGPPPIISATVEFDVAIVLPSGKTIHRPYKIWQWGNTDAGQPGLRFYSVCHHQGQVRIHGTKITAVAFERFKHDALYQEDGLWLDLNADNQMEEKTELFLTNSTVTVNGQAVQIKLDYP